MTRRKTEKRKEGIDKIEADPDRYSAILLDAMMSVMDGLEVLRRMGQSGLQDTIPVFLITAESSDEEIMNISFLSLLSCMMWEKSQSLTTYCPNFEVEEKLSLLYDNG